MTPAAVLAALAIVAVVVVAAGLAAALVLRRARDVPRRRANVEPGDDDTGGWDG